MHTAFRNVAAFHKACDVPVRDEPSFPDDSRVDLRINLIEEEVVKELFPAIQARDMLKTADGIADAIYVLIGAALEFGIPLPQVWEMVHGANMKKVDPFTGKVTRRADGKILKPAGWVSPESDIERLLGI